MLVFGCFEKCNPVFFSVFGAFETDVFSLIFIGLSVFILLFWYSWDFVKNKTFFQYKHTYTHIGWNRKSPKKNQNLPDKKAFYMRLGDGNECMYLCKCKRKGQITIGQRWTFISDSCFYRFLSW